MPSFLERVVPWPESEDAPGFVGLHYASKGSDGKKFWVGKPFKTFAEFTRQLWSWYIPKNEGADFYFCTSLQKTATTNKHGKPQAVRLQSNVACLKSFWADIDVKKKGGYPSLREAWDALKEFLCSTKLPPPTFIVGSGGGLHVYWTLGRAVSLAEWQPVANMLKNALIANGVKCDTGCTVDSVRILRVPGTLNHKTDPPKPVELLGARETDYELEDIAKPLAKYAGAPPSQTTTRSMGVATSAGAPSNWPELKKPDVLKDVVMESAGDGLDHEKPEFNLDAEAILGGCPFLSDSLRDGGARNANPLWNLTTLAATFLPDGERIAHDLAKGHETYTHDETQELYERKQREVEERGIRWPSCKSFEAADCTQCASCRHFGNIKSPLNLGLKTRIDGVVEKGADPVPATDVPGGDTGAHSAASDAPESHSVEFRGETISTETLFLPDGYIVDQAGCIRKLIYDPRTGAQDDVKLFQDPVWDPWTQIGDPNNSSSMRGLHFTTVGSKGSPDIRVFMPADAIMTEEKWRRFMLEGVSPKGGNSKPHMEDFLLSWQREIEQNRGSVRAQSFGWMDVDDDDHRNHAFVYGARRWNYDGTNSHSGYTDVVLRGAYDPKGQMETWQRGADYVWRQQRPELELIVASAFAAPLMLFTGQPGGTLSATGVSGAGKTTAITIAQAVWGCPKRAKEVLGTTENSLVGKIARLGNLPVYWDEIQGDEMMERLRRTLFIVNEGREKGRMNADTSQRKPGEWQTLMVTGSNESIYDHMVKHGHTNSAGLNRVIEFVVEKKDMTDGTHHAEIDQMVRTELNYHYGHAGLEYAKVLASESPRLPTLILATIKDFTHATGGDRPEERVWTAVAASCLLGATLANGAGITRFRLPELRQYLVDLLGRCRKRVADESLDASSDVNIEETLTAFFNEYATATIVTDTCTMSSRDGHKPVQFIRALPVVGAKPLTVQFVRDHMMVRISRRRFREWIERGDNSHWAGVMDGLAALYKLRQYQGHLGAGTTCCAGKERLLELRISKNTGLWSLLEALCKGDGRGVLPDEAVEVAA